jgi:hypothetical protein
MEGFADQIVVKCPIPAGPQAGIMSGQEKAHRCCICILDGI